MLLQKLKNSYWLKSSVKGGLNEQPVLWTASMFLCPWFLRRFSAQIHRLADSKLQNMSHVKLQGRKSEVYREAPTQKYKKTFLFKGETGVYLYLDARNQWVHTNIYFGNIAKLCASSMNTEVHSFSANENLTFGDSIISKKLIILCPNLKMNYNWWRLLFGDFSRLNF